MLTELRNLYIVNEILTNPWCGVAVCLHAIVWGVCADTMLDRWRLFRRTRRPDSRAGLAGIWVTNTIIVVGLFFWPILLTIYMASVMLFGKRSKLP